MKSAGTVIWFLLSLVSVRAAGKSAIQSALLDDGVIYTVPVSSNLVTTISFPGTDFCHRRSRCHDRPENGRSVPTRSYAWFSLPLGAFGGCESVLQRQRPLQQTDLRF